jgi:hypothetical protein
MGGSVALGIACVLGAVFSLDLILSLLRFATVEHQLKKDQRL